MGTVISFGIQKGGVGKTTTVAITALFLAKLLYRVLVIDFDCQGNATTFLTGRDSSEFEDRTLLNAFYDDDISQYIVELNPNLHLVPADDLLSTFARWLYLERNKYKYPDPILVFRSIIAPIVDNYDFILIDMPPHLGEQTLSALSASNYAVAMLQSDPFCYNALARFIKTLKIVQEANNPHLRLAGILATMIDIRAHIDRAVIEKASDNYGDVLFSPVIKRRARIKEFSATGLDVNDKQLTEVLEPYKIFVEELLKRVK